VSSGIETFEDGNRMECTLKFMSDWDAASYHRVSDPQRMWGLRVLDRLQPRGGERMLDIGCGTGRLTAEILARAPRAEVIAADFSGAMLAQARASAPPAIRFVQASGTALPFVEAFDAVFSTATFHWIHDHRSLFSEIHRVLRPNGRLVSQAGGGPNLRRLYEHSAAVASEDRFIPYFAGWRNPWTFAGVDDTRARLAAAGFRDIQVSLEPAPTWFPDARAFAEFTATVCLRVQLARLPADSRPAYVEKITALAAADDPPFTLDYWRLNIDGRK
jgi:ubiquinone/menaquinone biosynthesis C-methylase UbiE